MVPPIGFGDLPLEVQLMIFGLLASERTVSSCLPREALRCALVRAFHTNSRQDYSALAAAALVCRKWRALAENPLLWAAYRLPVSAELPAEQLMEALQFPRFATVHTLEFLPNDLLSSEEVQYSLQTRVEQLERVPRWVKRHARRLLCTSRAKVNFHRRLHVTRSSFP
jgi:hypothetical protein